MADVKVDLRPYRPQDLDALYRIALATGDSGRDASAMHVDPRLVGHLYVAPYAVLAPETAFVAEDAEGVCGYIVGARDTHAFEKRLEADWWPALRAAYPDPGPDAPQSADKRLIQQIHRPPRTPRRIAEPCPSHLHINLLPRLQGLGVGRRMIDLWLQTLRAMGSPAVHLGVSTANHRATIFYRAYGFREVERLPAPYDLIWFALDL